MLKFIEIYFAIRGIGLTIYHNYKKLQGLLIKDTMKVKPDNSPIKCLSKMGITGLLNPELNFFNQKR